MKITILFFKKFNLLKCFISSTWNLSNELKDKCVEADHVIQKLESPC